MVTISPASLSKSQEALLRTLHQPQSQYPVASTAESVTSKKGFAVVGLAKRGTQGQKESTRNQAGLGWQPVLCSVAPTHTALGDCAQPLSPTIF